MNSRIPTRPASTTSPLVGSSLDEASFCERGLLDRNSGSVMLRSSMPTPPKYRTEGEIEKVKVYIRIRPALREDETPGALVWSEGDGQLTIFRPEAPVPQSDFMFDKVLGPNASQADVYTAAVSDVVADVLRGYNGTILAYGQTGAGKTYTLGNTAPDAIGMIPRAAAELFSAAARDSASTYRITMSYIQIYMEMIQDLLNPTADNLPIREDAGGVFVAGACEVPVTSLEECLHYLELGEQNRVFAFTHLNAHSSRSHAVVMLTVVKSRKYLTDEERVQAEAPDQDGVVTQKVTVGKLYMVDLAGSERLKKSRSVGLRATEARSINLSLTMLGMCISARAQDSQHVPFRDSKLTRLLQESLGGNAKTSLILCLSDVRQHVDESLQSLQFGSRAARVCNKPVVNERLQMRQLTAELLAALEEGNERTNGLEQALSQTKEERDALQAALARERARSAAIVEALRAEARAKDEHAAAKLAEQAELLSEHVQQLGQVQQQQGQLEMEVATLRAEQRARDEAHKAEVAELQQRLAAVQQAAAVQRRTMEAEAWSQQARLVAAAQQQAAALSSQLAQERTAAREQAASIHVALTRLQRALGELVSGPAPAEDGSGGTGVYNIMEGPLENADASGGGGGGGTLAPRPTWVKAGLAAAAAAAASRRVASSGSGAGDGCLSSGGSSAVQMIQAALGLTEAASDGEDDGDAGPDMALRSENFDVNSAGPTVSAIAALVGGGAGPGSVADGSRRLRHSHSTGSAAAAAGGSLRDQRLMELSDIGSATSPISYGATSASLRRANPGGSGGGLNSQSKLQQQQHQQQQEQLLLAPSSTQSIMLHSSDIADIDAALAAAQQDLIEDLRAAAAAAATASGSRPGSASGHTLPASASPGWSGAGHAHAGLPRPLSHAQTGTAAAVASAAAAAGIAQVRFGSMPSGQDATPAAAAAVSTSIGAAAAAVRHGSPRSNRNSVGGASGSYAAEYATAVANGITSPAQQQHRSYIQLHGGGAAATVSSAPKVQRRHGQSAGSFDGGAGGGLKGEPSGGISGPMAPNMGPDSARSGGAHLSTPFMNERAATAVSPPPASRNSSAGGAASVNVDGDVTAMRRCSGVINVNPAFGTSDSEGLKSEDMLAAMSAAGISFTALVAPGTAPPPVATAAPTASGVDLASGQLRERLTSAEGAAASGGLLAPCPTLAPPPPPLPIFTGIQIQLDALMDVALVMRRIKAGLEARVVAQACQLARQHEEQQHLSGDLQATRGALAAAESQLATTTEELDALRLVLAETVDELGRTRRELDGHGADLEQARRKLEEMAGLYDSALMRLGETRGRLDDALGELDLRREESLRLGSQLEQTLSDLAAERSALARIRAASARSVAMTTQALAARHEVQRQIRAANTIKAAFKRYKLAQLRVQVEAKHQALRDAEAHRREREAVQAARAGQALVQESVGAIRDGVGSILAAFVGRRYQLDARKSLHDRLERMLSHGGSSTASASKVGTPTAAKLPPMGLSLSIRRPLSAAGASSGGGGAAAAVGLTGGSRSSGGGVPPPPPLPITPGGGRRQMSSPLGLTMMLSAVTLAPLTPASVSTTASTSRPADGGGTDGGAYSMRRQRQSFPPPPLQLPDDCGASTSSTTPPKPAADGSVGGGGGSVAISSGGCGVGGSGGGAIITAKTVGGGSVLAGSGSNGGAATGSAISPSSVGGGGGAAATSRGTGRPPAAAAAAAVIQDVEDVVSPAHDDFCSSSSSCSGAVLTPSVLHDDVCAAAEAAAAAAAAAAVPMATKDSR